MRTEIDTEWMEYFPRNGLPAARGLPSRMDGIYTLVDNELIAKVWLGRDKSELRRLKASCDALKLSAGAIRTPKIKGVKVVDGVLSRFEWFLMGEAFQIRLSRDAYSPARKDGHFCWSVTMLKREDVRASIGL